ncbi:hypothetical protein F2P81_011312 [Scophthalmus maximus]|uniref:Transcription elongation factor A (SII), 2 n=1 Tax=Scophthalmus maximus TaxID=52904 RepID=A0A6A4SVU2_SCOMX|nr:hypothetical protein F2P81_011312 [Scophthalmus maximus]
MAKDQEVERIAKKLDKMVHKKNTDGALDLLRELKNIKMSLETLQVSDSTRRDASHPPRRVHLKSDKTRQYLPELRLTTELHQSWDVRERDGSEGKSEEKEKKKEGSPVRSSSTSKDSGSSEKSVRNKCRELLVAALQTDDDHKTIGVDCNHLAAQIEEHILSPHAIFQEFKSTDIKYKTRLRSRISNLKDQKNPDLRRNVLCGNISPQRIASMTAEEMASAELKQIREALTKESIREHQLSKVGGSETDMFICNKCHGKSCTYTQVQTRSADEPMTTFVLCNSCGNRWKLYFDSSAPWSGHPVTLSKVPEFLKRRRKNKKLSITSGSDKNPSDRQETREKANERKNKLIDR